MRIIVHDQVELLALKTVVDIWGSKEDKIALNKQIKEYRKKVKENGKKTTN